MTKDDGHQGGPSLFYYCMSAIAILLLVLALTALHLLISRNEKQINMFWLHYENTPIQIYICIEKLQPKKENFQLKNSDILLIPAQNIDCGYSLKPPLRFAFCIFLLKI